MPAERDVAHAMYRRQVLATGAVALTVTSGCLGSGGGDDDGTGGNDDDPFDTDAESLLMTVAHVESVTGEEWAVRTGEPIHDRPLTYSDADAMDRIVPAGSEEETLLPDMLVMSGVWLEETVEAARESYESHPSYDSYYIENGAAEVSIGVESIARTVDGPRGMERLVVLFRDANAIGAVTYRNPSVSTDDRTDTCVDLAAEMHTNWRE